MGQPTETIQANDGAYANQTNETEENGLQNQVMEEWTNTGNLAQNPGSAEQVPDLALTYTVVRGDSLWKIAEQQLGAGTRWPEIYNLNKETIGDNPNLIYPGQEFVLPSSDSSTQKPQEAAEEATAVTAEEVTAVTAEEAATQQALEGDPFAVPEAAEAVAEPAAEAVAEPYVDPFLLDPAATDPAGSGSTVYLPFVSLEDSQQHEALEEAAAEEPAEAGLADSLEEPAEAEVVEVAVEEPAEEPLEAAAEEAIEATAEEPAALDFSVPAEADASGQDIEPVESVSPSPWENWQPEDGIYNALAVPGFDLRRGSTVEMGYFTEEAAGVSRRDLVDSIEGANGEHIYNYEGGINFGHFTGSETWKDGQLQERHIVYDGLPDRGANIGQLRDPSAEYDSGVSFSVDTPFGPHAIEGVKQVDTVLDGTSGNYKTTIKAAEGAEYLFVTDAEGNPVDFTVITTPISEVRGSQIASFDPDHVSDDPNQFLYHPALPIGLGGIEYGAAADSFTGSTVYERTVQSTIDPVTGSVTYTHTGWINNGLIRDTFFDASLTLDADGNILGSTATYSHWRDQPDLRFKGKAGAPVDVKDVQNVTTSIVDGQYKTIITDKNGATTTIYSQMDGTVVGVY